MSLLNDANAKMPSLRDKLVDQVAQAEAMQKEMELKDEKADKIIKKSAKKK